jgi:outer membrane murein-binding lipoprotein Lpp
MKCPHCDELLIEEGKRKPWEDPNRDKACVFLCGFVCWLLAIGFGLNAFLVSVATLFGAVVLGNILAGAVDNFAKDKLEKTLSSRAQRAAQNRRDVDAWYEASKAGKPDKTSTAARSAAPDGSIDDGSIRRA